MCTLPKSLVECLLTLALLIAAPSLVLPAVVSEQDLTGDGSVDVLMSNSHMWLQINRDDERPGLNGVIDAGGLTGQGSFLATPIYSGGIVDRVAYWRARDYSVEVIQNNGQRGTVRVTNVDTANGKEVTRQFIITLESELPYAWIDIDMQNSGTSSFLFDEIQSHVHDGAVISHFNLVQKDDIETYVHDLGDIGMNSLTWWASYAPKDTAPFCTSYRPSTSDAVTYGFKSWGSPIHQVVAYYTGATVDTTPALAFMASEFVLAPQQEIGWQAVVAFHTGGIAQGTNIFAGAVEPQPMNDWCDDFEGVSSLSWSTLWHASGNSGSVALDNLTTYGGGQSIRMFGLLGGCWGTVFTRPLGTTYPMTIEVALQNGVEPLSGCHPFRGGVNLRPGPDWTDVGLPLFDFLSNGDLRITFLSAAPVYTGFNPGQWYKFQVSLLAPGDGLLHARFIVDGNLLGEFTRPWESWMSSDQYLSIQVDEGSAWFDDVCVHPGVNNGSLWFPPVSVSDTLCEGEMIVQPVEVVLTQPTVALNIPIKIPEGVTVVSASLDGLPTEGWDETVETQVDNSARFLRLVLAHNPIETLSVGTHTVANILFTASPLCRQSRYIHWDTTLSEDVERRLGFTHTMFQTYLPDFDPMRDSSEIQGYEPGDLNRSGGIDLSDLSSLINYLTLTPLPTLCLKQAADINGSKVIDISDLSLFIAYLTSTPRPTLQCAPSGSPAMKEAEGLEYETLALGGRNSLILGSDELLLGLLLKVRTTGEFTSHLPTSIDVIAERSGDEVTILAIDLEGKEMIPQGRSVVLTFDAPFEVLSAEGSTKEFITVSALSGGVAPSIPTSYSLRQNYPNPFNPATEISYSLPVQSHVKLEIYNLTGQHVSTLVDADQAAGDHRVQWDAGQFASGVYLYRLSAGEFIQTKKMLLLK